MTEANGEYIDENWERRKEKTTKNSVNGNCLWKVSEYAAYLKYSMFHA